MASFGPALRRTREEKGISLDDIAGETRLSKRYLLALEDEAIHKLPGGTYNRAYLRTYAGYLGLDIERLVREYSLEEAHQTEIGRLQPQPDILTSIGKAVESRQTTTGAQQTWTGAGSGPPTAAGRIAAFAGSGAARGPAAGRGCSGSVSAASPATATSQPCQRRPRITQLRKRPRLPTGWPRFRRMKRRNSLELKPAATSGRVDIRGWQRGSPSPAPVAPKPVAPPSKAAPPPVPASPRSGGCAAEGSIDGASRQATSPVGDRLRSRAPDVVDRRLVGESDTFVVGTRVTFWTRIAGGRGGDTINHVWFHNGVRIGTTSLRVGSADWRTQSRQLLTPEGQWAVEARDAEGRVLVRHTFRAATP